jgi:hypothetical protein
MGADQVTRFGRVRKVATVTVVTLIVAALSFLVAQAVIGTRAQGAPLTTSNFTISSTIYTTHSGTYPAATCSGSPALLYPGVTRCVVFSVHNNLNVPITVQGITTVLDSGYSAPPAVCSGSNLTLPTLSGSFVVGGSSTANSRGVPILLKESGTNQDACKNFVFHFLYSGTAQYTDSTTTSLTSSLNPSTFGQLVTFTATVTATNAATDASRPSGTVTFYECANSPCSTTMAALTGAVPVSSSTGKASFSASAFSLGTHYLDAIYTPFDATNFMTSNGRLTQTVGLPTSCSNGTINGSVTAKSGQIICLTGKVNGGVTVQPGGALYLNGATVSGGVTSTGATALRICATAINGGVSVTTSTGFVMIGDGGDEALPACTANTISGGVTLTNNTGGVELGGNNISGTVTISGNVTTPFGEGVAEVEGNKITGSLSCATSNSPVLSNGGYHNTVTGTKSGQCSGAGF